MSLTDPVGGRFCGDARGPISAITVRISGRIHWADSAASSDEDASSTRIEPAGDPRYTAAVVHVMGCQVEPTACWADRIG
jgi:hypothetical protein